MNEYKINTNDGKYFIVLSDIPSIDMFTRSIASSDKQISFHKLSHKHQYRDYTSYYVAIKASQICSLEYIGEKE